MLQLRIGFDLATPEDQAVGIAVAEWRGMAANNPHIAAGPPLTRVVRDDPAHTVLDEYVVEVTEPHGDQP